MRLIRKQIIRTSGLGLQASVMLHDGHFTLGLHINVRRTSFDVAEVGDAGGAGRMFDSIPHCPAPIPGSGSRGQTTRRSSFDTEATHGIGELLSLHSLDI